VSVGVVEEFPGLFFSREFVQPARKPEAKARVRRRLKSLRIKGDIGFQGIRCKGNTRIPVEMPPSIRQKHK